jgi:hypothetical protein
MDNIKDDQSNSLQIATWMLIGIIVFLPMLIPSQSFEVLQLISLGVLIAIQFKVGIQSKVVLGAFSFAYIALTGLWLIGL